MGERIEDGGPIHPIPEIRDADGCGIMAGWNGMSLRDWFAGQALQGMASSAGFQGAPWGKLAHDAYEAADAMIQARGQEPRP